MNYTKLDLFRLLPFWKIHDQIISEAHFITIIYSETTCSDPFHTPCSTRCTSCTKRSLREPGPRAERTRETSSDLLLEPRLVPPVSLGIWTYDLQLSNGSSLASELPTIATEQEVVEGCFAAVSDLAWSKESNGQFSKANMSFPCSQG